MTVALDLIEFQTRSAERVAHDVDVGALLRVERPGIQPSNPRLDVMQQAARSRDARRTEIIQHVIERCALMNVVAVTGGIRGRQRQRAQHEVIHQLLEHGVGRRRLGIYRRRPGVRNAQEADQPSTMTAADFVHALYSDNSRRFVQPSLKL